MKAKYWEKKSRASVLGTQSTCNSGLDQGNQPSCSPRPARLFTSCWRVTTEDTRNNLGTSHFPDPSRPSIHVVMLSSPQAAKDLACGITRCTTLPTGQEDEICVAREKFWSFQRSLGHHQADLARMTTMRDIRIIVRRGCGTAFPFAPRQLHCCDSRPVPISESGCPASGCPPRLPSRFAAKCLGHFQNPE